MLVLTSLAFPFPLAAGGAAALLLPDGCLRLPLPPDLLLLLDFLSIIVLTQACWELAMCFWQDQQRKVVHELIFAV